jgi:threonine synthase
MNSTWKLISSDSSEEYDNNSPVWISEKGNLLQLSHSLIFSPELINHEIQGMWRYEKMLPISYESKVSFNEGMTPIVKEKISGKSLQFKLEYLFPTGSYKDRGASVLVSKIKELGISNIVEDSSGNAGVAIATYASKAGIKSEIYVSQMASQTKLKQLKNVGANVVLINGSREDVAHAAKERSKEIYYASHAINPFFFSRHKNICL